MWVYRQVAVHDPDEPGSDNKYEVGFYGPHPCPGPNDPAMVWHRDSTHKSRDTAGNRVNYLNGGSGGHVQKIRIVGDRSEWRDDNG